MLLLFSYLVNPKSSTLYSWGSVLRIPTLLPSVKAEGTGKGKTKGSFSRRDICLDSGLSVALRVQGPK